MLDAEIYVDRIADMRINDMNTVLEAVRQMVLSKREDSANDLYLRTLELAQVPEEEYFGHVVADDLNRDTPRYSGSPQDRQHNGRRAVRRSTSTATVTDCHEL